MLFLKGLLSLASEASLPHLENERQICHSQRQTDVRCSWPRMLGGAAVSPEDLNRAIGTCGHGSGEPLRVPGTTTAYEPFLLFPSCSARVMLVLNILSLGAAERHRETGKRLRPAALSNVDPGTLSHRSPDGSKPEARVSAQPPWQLFLCSVAAGGVLPLPAECSAPSPKGGLTGNWTPKRVHQKPNGICLCSGKRGFERAGTSQPSCPIQTTCSFLCALPPPAPPLRLILPPQHAGRAAATRRWKNSGDL